VPVAVFVLEFLGLGLNALAAARNEVFFQQGAYAGHVPFATTGA